MKSLVVAFTGMFLLLIGMPTIGFGTTALTEADNTTKWTYPYVAPNDKAERLKDGIKVIRQGKRGTPVSKFIELLGIPDQITDLHKGFEGMSVREDGMLSEYRQYLSYRLVWYIKKQSAANHSLNDVWFAAYVGNGSDGVFKIVTNKIE